MEILSSETTSTRGFETVQEGGKAVVLSVVVVVMSPRYARYETGLLNWRGKMLHSGQGHAGPRRRGPRRQSGGKKRARNLRRWVAVTPVPQHTEGRRIACKRVAAIVCAYSTLECNPSHAYFTVKPLPPSYPEHESLRVSATVHLL